VERKAETGLVGRWIRELDVRPPEPGRPVSTLSGGNQQKVLLAKWLATGPQLLVLHEPTQAVDVGARRTITAAVRTAADSGCAVLVAGTDETELTMLCDRVLVFRDGRIATELSPGFTPDDVVEAIFSGHLRKTLRSARPAG
jgi:ribose transport system ATP-binding protein